MSFNYNQWLSWALNLNLRIVLKVIEYEFPYFIISCHLKFKSNHTVVRKKKSPCAKNEPWRKNLFVKNFMFFVDKLNMIDFNIFNMLKLIFTCESVAYLLQNSFVNVRFQLNSIFSYLLFWLSLWRLVSSLSALFCVDLLGTLFYSLSWDNS